MSETPHDAPFPSEDAFLSQASWDTLLSVEATKKHRPHNDPRSTAINLVSTDSILKENGGSPRNPMDSFLTACEATAPLTLEIEGPGIHGTERRAYPQPFILVGRDERADLLLDHDLVSRRHVYLQLIEGRLFFVDLDSRSGTLIGKTPTESGWLTTGASISVGPFTVRHLSVTSGHGPISEEASDSDSGFEFRAITGGEGGVPLNPLLARSSEATPLPRVSLEFQSRTAGHSIWRMSQVMALVGSSPRCKVRLLDSNVSKLHCALLRTSQGLWVIDLLGRGGITVSGTAVRFARLAVDDVLGLGEVIVRPNFETENTRGRSPSGATGVWNAAPPAAPPALASRPWGPPAAQPAAVPAYLQPARPTGPPEFTGSEPGLSLLLNHFGQMQQQMLDQFQSSMMMMMQMFNGMHRDQMGLVREELDRLRELGDEIQQIKVQMAASTAAAPQPLPPPPPYSLPPGTAPWQGNIWTPSGRPATPYVNGPSPRNDPQRAPNGAAPGTSPAGPNPFAARPQTRPATLPQGSPDTPPEANHEIHEWLNDRLVAITNEQQTRFQKIMGILKANKSS